MLVAAIFLLFTCLLIYFQRNQDKSNSGNDANRHSVKLGFGQTVHVALHCFWRGINYPIFEYLHDLQKIYGKVFIFSLGIKNIAYGIISDLHIAQSICTSSEWTNRTPDGHFLLNYSWGKPYGLLFGSGEYSRIGRKLTKKIFQQLGVSRVSKLEQIATMEYLEAEEDILKACTNTDDSIVEMGHHFQRYTLNIIYQLLFSERYDRGNKEGEALVHAITAANKGFRIDRSMAGLWPSLNKLPFIEIKPLKIVSDLLFADFNTRIEKRRQSGSYRENPQDYIDHFLIEIDRHRNDEDAEYYSDKNLMGCMRDLITAGMDTSSTTINCAILHLAQNLHVQQRVQAEIDQVLGSRTPLYRDKANMKYTEAFLWENLRYASPAPLGLRSPTKETTFYGTNMSKSSLAIINIHAIHRSSDIWSDPDVFRPERFLDENQDTLINLEKIMPFGYGKRSCIAESIAKPTAFIFVVSLLQRFTFEMSNKHPSPTSKGQFGMAKSSVPFYVKVQQRKAQMKTG